MRYFLNDFENFQLLKGMYEKRQEDIKNRDQEADLDFTRVKESVDLEMAGVSKREYEQIKLLLSVDENMFKPSEYGTFSPHSLLVDLSKYENLPKDAKEILYRPPRVKLLYEKYWQLVH